MTFIELNKLKGFRLQRHADYLRQGRCCCSNKASLGCRSNHARVTQSQQPRASTIQLSQSSHVCNSSSSSFSSSYLVAAPQCSGQPSPVGSRGAARAAVAVRSSSSTAVESLLGRQLTQEEESTWKASCEVLESSLGFSSEEAARLMARAFGWTTQAFWRQEKIEELPSPGQVTGALSVLRGDLEMTSEEAARVVRVLPELLACDVEGRLRANIAQLGSQYRLKGPTLTKAVLRQPAVLGYSLDCGGDCIGECNRCWVRF